MTSETVLSGPLIHRFATSKDPFSSLARPLPSEEYFLLDHCTSIDALADYRGLPFQISDLFVDIQAAVLLRLREDWDKEIHLRLYSHSILTNLSEFRPWVLNWGNLLQRVNHSLSCAEATTCA